MYFIFDYMLLDRIKPVKILLVNIRPMDLQRIPVSRSLTDIVQRDNDDDVSKYLQGSPDGLEYFPPRKMFQHIAKNRQIMMLRVRMQPILDQHAAHLVIDAVFFQLFNCPGIPFNGNKLTGTAQNLSDKLSVLPRPGAKINHRPGLDAGDLVPGYEV